MKFKETVKVIIIVLVVFLSFMVLHNIIGTSMFEHSSWDTYDLQAEAWINGRNYLDHDYPHLELAVYKDNYYVSFPPFPSVILFPFVLIMGLENVPDHFIICCIVAINVVVAYKILKKHKTNEFFSILIAVGLVLGSNMVSMATNSGPWFIAQALNMLLCTLAVGFFLKDKRTSTYICLALAVRM